MTKSDVMGTSTRRLGRSELRVSPLGLGCWPIGGAMAAGDQPRGYTGVDDAESTRALHRAVELGVTLFDTADAYGAGHSERQLAEVLAAHPEVLVATKFGNTFDERTRQLTGQDLSPGYVRRALQASLRRLGRDRVDLYQVHPADLVGGADDLVATLEDLVTEGLIGWYGVSAAEPAQVEPLVGGPHFGVVQLELNVFDGHYPLLAFCERHDLGALCRSPLAMGLLGGRYAATSRLPADDIRAQNLEWLPWFADGRPSADYLERIGQVRAALTGGGRTLAQGALAWIWARDPRAVPLPGFRTTAQVEDLAGAVRHGPLTPAELEAVEVALGRR